MEQKKKILIIDDEPQVIKGTPEILKEAGYLVWMAGNAEEAMEKLKAFNPDLILLDLVLPDQSGFRIAQNIKSLAKYQHIPIIAISLKTEPIDKHIAVKSGIVEYMEKPVDNDRLLYHVKSILNPEIK